MPARREPRYPPPVPLIIAGIDEAGYGPLLGPLCVGLAAFEVADWSPGDPAPDLWSLLSGAVCRKPGDKRRRVAIEDSKKLKLPNDSPTRHPLTHLERGVLTTLAAMNRPIASDTDLLTALSATEPASSPQPWYTGDPIALPLATTADELSIAANTLARGFSQAGVRPIHLGCRVMHEAEFNALVTQWSTKAATTGLAIREHLRLAWREWGASAGSDAAEDGSVLRVVCDRQGGRTAYAESLARWVTGAEVATLEESPARSRYLLRGTGDDGQPREMGVIFQPEAESACLPVALASMAAKLVRELQMMRLNRHFAQRLPELKPTAGYRQDAARWLRDARAVISASERQALTRIA